MDLECAIEILQRSLESGHAHREPNHIELVWAGEHCQQREQRIKLSEEGKLD